MIASFAQRAVGERRPSGRRVRIGIGLAACAASAALLACGEPRTVVSHEPAEQEPAAGAPAPGPPAAEPAPIPPEPTAAVPPAPAPAPAPPPEPAPPAAAPAEPAISLEELETRLRQTSAIGTFSKLSLKNDIDDLVDALRGYHARKEGDLDALHQRYEALVLKVMALLQEDEPELALALGRSRERIWDRLVDPVEFAKLST
jgi:hypothetical protein